MKKVKKNMWKKEWEIIVLLLTIILLPYFTYQYAMAIHNIDLIYNINNLASKINKAGFTNENQTLYIPVDLITDFGSDFQERPLHEYYIGAMNALKKYFFYSIFDMMVLGLILARRLK